MIPGTLALLALALGVGAYLAYVMLHPERF